MNRPASRLRAFTLVELMIVVAIIGVLAALAVYGVSRYVANAKTSEGRSGVGAMAKGNAARYHDERWNLGTPIPDGTSTGYLNTICKTGTANRPMPASVPPATKYQSSESDWRDPDGEAGWSCLRFNMNTPQYFQYDYEAQNVQSPTSSFTCMARGDLNGNGKASLFVLTGGVEGGRVKIAPALGETDPYELEQARLRRC